jgi:23S rRNA (pseudouridine1915-N3)-methyltransferase
MNLMLVHIHPRPASPLPYEGNVTSYLKLASRWMPATARGFGTEEAFQAYLSSAKQRTVVVLGDMRGAAKTSQEFAAWVGERRDSGVGQLVLAIGPADGWSAGMLEKADLRLSFGAMTLPHALARLVLAEQVYRAATIIGGHPYHLGH